jgi:hypothetical protein
VKYSSDILREGFFLATKPGTLNSSQVTEGLARSPHRSLFYAMGYTPEELKKPIIGIVNAFNEIVPGHIHLRDLAQAAKLGVELHFPAQTHRFSLEGKREHIEDFLPAKKAEFMEKRGQYKELQNPYREIGKWITPEEK